MKLPATTLDDKYVQTSGTMFMTGTQALVKLVLLQRALDAARGLNTAGFVSGYRGSPLGNLDIALWGARELLDRNQIRFQPAVNEELAATACWGTQQAMLMPDAKYDGVFAAWYGKGPGVDRSGDALKHGNLAGTARHGGVLVLAGDDHMSKSSTLAHQSEQALMAALIPVLNPPSVREYLHLGLAGWALSRFAGVWVGLKCLADTVDSSGTIAFDLEHARFDVPSMGEDFARFRAPLATLQTRLEEEALLVHRLEAARAFARHNRLDRPLWRPARRRLALVTAGKPHVATLQALSDLGIDRRAGEALGLGIYNVTMPWPLDVDSLRDFVVGYDEVLFIEDKRAIVEPQAAHALYNLAPELRPRVTGKRGLDEAPLLPSHGELSPTVIRRAVLARLTATGPLDPGLSARADHLDSHEARVLGAVRTVAPRTAAFCSG
ncbi:MAG: indolepyruvate ferredoxin oxidoreductase family protein, partial [Steroidobacteraceae bacterium]